MFLSICLSICLSVYLSICVSVYLSIYLWIGLSIYLPVYLSVYLSFCLSVCLSMCLSVNLSIWLSDWTIHVSVNLSIYLSMYVSNCLSVILTIWQSMYVSIYLAICLPGYLTTYLSVYMSLCLPVYLSTYLFISLSLSLSIYLSIHLSISERTEFCQDPFKCGKRSNSARLPQKQEVDSSKTKKFCEPSTFELDDVKNEAILRDYLQTIKRWVRNWRPRTNAFCDFSTPSVQSTAPARKKWSPATQNHLSKPEDLMLQNATPLGKSAPWPPNISDEAVSCTAPAQNVADPLLKPIRLSQLP